MAQTTVLAVGISIIDHTISIVPSAVGKTYSAGPNIGIYDVSGQPTISSKDWSNEIADASANAYEQSTSYFNNWVNGQYTGDISNITNNITALSGDLSSYYKKTETSSKEQINDALQYVSAHAVGDVEVNNYVHNNSATIDEVNSAYKANSALYITAHQSLDGYATEDWVNAQGYITGVNIPESATWNDTSNVVSSNSASWSKGTTYEGISPIVVNNDESKISADSWTLSAGDGISFTENSANKVTRIDVTAQGGDEGVNSFVTENSATILDVNSSYKANSGTWNEVSAKVDTTALIPTIDSNAINYSAKPTDNPIYASGNQLKNVDYIDGKVGLAIVPNGVLQIPSVITATNGVIQVPNAITATNGALQVPNTITAVPNNTLNVPGVITSNQGGLTAYGLSANTNNGLTANGLTADAVHSSFSANGISAGKQGSFIIQGLHESISSNNKAGFIFSSDDTNFSSATLTTAGINNTVGMPSPMFEARNISGAGFSIEASGAKGYDERGNVVWDTSNPQVKNIISYADTKTAQGGLTGNIILTTQPSTNASNLTNSPYVIMDAYQASYFASFGPSAQTPTVKLVPGTITVEYQAGNAKTTVGYNDVKQELSGSSWTLTGSIQKRELEYDANTSAITAINGSALGGQGGGGGSVSSKYGTISVDGSNIEATNKAIEYNSNGFTSSFDNTSTYSGFPVIFTWYNYSQGTRVTANVYNESQGDATLTYSSNTNVTGEVTGAPLNIINLDVQIPNATAIQFSADKIFRIENTRVSAPSSFKVSELAWKSDLPTYEYDRNHKVSAINGSALVGNEDYLVGQGFAQNLTSPNGTISVFNNNKIEGTNSAIKSDTLIEGFVSSYNDFNVYPDSSGTLTWDRYVPNTMLYISGSINVEDTSLTYSADTGVTGVITFPHNGEVIWKVPTDSTSIVIGNEDWSRMKYNFTVSAENYYEIGELAWASALPSFEYDNTNKISAINGSALAGGNLPVSADEAIQYVQTKSGTIDNVVTNVQTNSGVWGGSALPISAGPGIGLNLDNNVLIISSNGAGGGFYSTSALLYQGSKNDQRTTAWNLTESISSYKMIQCDWVDTNNYFVSKQIPIPSGLGSDMTRAAFFDAVFEYGSDLWCKAQRFSAQNNTVYAQVDEYCVHTDGSVSNVGSDVQNNRPIMVQIIGVK